MYKIKILRFEIKNKILKTIKNYCFLIYTFREIKFSNFDKLLIIYACF